VHTRLKEREIRSVIALGDPEWRPALLGLVANTIADEYERPVFLWGREGNMSLKGSFRSGGFTQSMELIRTTENMFAQFGGHAAAGGFTLLDTEVFFLEDRLVEAHARLEAGEESDSLASHADAVITPEEATLAFLKKVERLAPFGQMNPKPVFLLREVMVRDVTRFGKAQEHLKLKIEMNEGRGSVDAVTFFVKGAIARAADTLAKGSRVNALVHLERDTFSRGAPVRLRLIDIRLV
jgi:single-stranded-DNA-specific exonuclease